MQQHCVSSSSSFSSFNHTQTLKYITVDITKLLLSLPQSSGPTRVTCRIWNWFKMVAYTRTFFIWSNCILRGQCKTREDIIRKRKWIFFWLLLLTLQSYAYVRASTMAALRSCSDSKVSKKVRPFLSCQNNAFAGTLALPLTPQSWNVTKPFNFKLERNQLQIKLKEEPESELSDDHRL